MLDKLKALKEEALAELELITDREALKQLENRTTGKKGEITLALRSIGQLSAEERPAVGKLANELRNELDAAFASREELIRSHELARQLEESTIDVTLPGRSRPMGRLPEVRKSARP